MKLSERFGRALVWSAGGAWGRQCVSFVVFGIIARVVPPAAFGLVALARAFVAFGQVLVDQGMSDAIVQRKDLEKGHLDTAFWVTLAMGIGLALVGLAVARPIAAAFSQPQLAPVLSWMVLALPLAALDSIQQAILRRALNFRALAVRSLVATVVGGGVGIVLALTGWGVWALVAQMLVTSVVGVATLWTVSGWRPGMSVSRTHANGLVSFGWNIGGATVLGFFSRRSGDLIIGYFLGPVALGYYSIAYRAFDLVQSALVTVTGAVAYPVLAKLQSTPQRVTSVFLELTRFMSVVAFPMVVGVSLTAPELVTTAFGPHWAASARVLRILVFGGVISALFVFNAIVFKTMGKPAWVFRLAGLDALANVTAFLIAVRWGIVAVAAAFVIRAYVMVPIRLWLLPKVIPFKLAEYLRGFAPAAVGTVAMAAVVLVGRAVVGQRLSPTHRLAVFGLAGAIVYVGVVVVAAPALSRRVLEVTRLTCAPAVRRLSAMRWAAQR